MNETSLAPGTILSGRYRIESVLGEGGFGITYRAIDERLERPVAIKEHFPMAALRDGVNVRMTGRTSGQTTSEGIQRFLNEARLLAQMGRSAHAGIVTGHDVFEENGTAYLVMEYVNGVTLEHLVKSQGPLGNHRLERLADALCSALEVVHSHKDAKGKTFLHQDISPANVMIVEGGTSSERPVLIDFGAARAFAAEASSDASRIVKVGYSPMESYSERATRGSATDFYALGATLYFAATGVEPIDSMARATGVELPPLSSLAPSVGANVCRAIDWCMEPQFASRPQTSAQIVQVLRATESRTQVSRSSPTRLIETGSPTPNVVSTNRGSSKAPYLLLGLVFAAAVGLVAFLVTSREQPELVVGSTPATSAGTEASAAEPTETSAAVGAQRTSEPAVQIQPSGASGFVGRSPVPRLKCTGQGIRFDAKNLIDGDTNTGWGASDRDGTGTSIDVTFPSSVLLSKVGLTPGFLRVAPRYDLGCETVNAFHFNRTLVSARYEFDNGTYVIQNFADQPTLQTIEIEPVRTSTVRITILSTDRPPGADNDTIVSEAAFFGTF